MVERAGNAAFVGHRVEVKTGGKKDEKKTVLYTAPKAYNSFLYDLRKLYPKKEGGGKRRQESAGNHRKPSGRSTLP